MDVEEECAFALVALQLLKRKRIKRQYWIHPFLRDRSSRGVFITHYTYADLRRNPEKFFTYSRMSVESFDELLSFLKEEITGSTTRMRDCVPPEEKLLVTL